MSDGEKTIQRWTAKRRHALVLQLIKGETTAREASRKHGLKVKDIEAWRDRVLMGAEDALRTRTRDEVAMREAETKRLKQKIGSLVMDIDILKEAQKGHPFFEGTSNE